MQAQEVAGVTGRVAMNGENVDERRRRSLTSCRDNLLPRGLHTHTNQAGGAGLLPRVGDHDGRNQSGGRRRWCRAGHASLHEVVPATS